MIACLDCMIFIPKQKKALEYTEKLVRFAEVFPDNSVFFMIKLIE